MQQQIWIFDFDGTITLDDVGNKVCDHFAPAGWRALENAWLEGDISLGEAQRKIWAQVVTSRAEAERYAHDCTALRPGLSRLLAHISGNGGESWVASGGFDFYIDSLLAEHKAKFSRSYYNRAIFEPSGVALDFPHPYLACSSCAICKGKVCDLARATGAQVTFIGDGPSDRCVLDRCDNLAVVEGSFLEKFAQTKNHNYLIFKDFSSLLC